MKFSFRHPAVYLYGLLMCILFLFSFTQVDLSLTLTQSSIFSVIQHAFQHIGFYERQLAAGIYIGIIVLLFFSYVGSLIGIVKGKIEASHIWTIAVLAAGILTFSYPAVSYDLFNYLFTAKTVLVYGKNPYEVLPIQFLGVDPFLSFMRWTHLPSAYTPFWIGITLPLYLLSFNLFLPSMWIFKGMMALCYLITVLGIWEALKDKSVRLRTLGVGIFALNPLVIIESLVGSHNDIAMMAFATWAIVMYRRRKMWVSWILLSFSIALKLMTVFLLPAFAFRFSRKIAALLMSAAFISILFEREVLPWYFLWVIPFVAMLPEYSEVYIIAIGVSLGLLLRYAPYFYFGHWDPPVPEIKLWVTLMPIFLSIVTAIIVYISRKRVIKH